MMLLTSIRHFLMVVFKFLRLKFLKDRIYSLEQENKNKWSETKPLLKFLKIHNLKCMFCNEIVLWVFLTISSLTAVAKAVFNLEEAEELCCNKLISVVLLFIESDFLQGLDISEAIKMFVWLKARKKNLTWTLCKS